MKPERGLSVGERTENDRVSALKDGLKFFLLIGFLTWLMLWGIENLSYNWQWYQIPQYFFTVLDGRFITGPLLEGLKVTIQISGISLFFAFFIGMITALLRRSGSLTAKVFSRGYLELVRNTPLLVQLFFIYFILSPILGISRFASAVLALSLFEGAYASEIFRSGIVSIHKGQWEAAYSIGLNTFGAYRHVILPQAIRRILPPLTNQAVSLVKDSALVSTIAVYDLAMQGQVIVAETFLTFEVWFTIAAVYLVITVTFSVLADAMEKRLKVEL